MNSRWILLLLACCNLCEASTPFPSTEVPAILKAGLAPGEQVISLVRYDDAHGDHTLMLSEQIVAAKSGTGKSFNLAAISFDKNGAREWVIRDGAECPIGSAAKPTFFPIAAPATDLNNDGKAEITVAYSLSCGTGSEPTEVKAIMRQGEDKYAMRGQTLVYTPGRPLRGGMRKPDAALLLPMNAAFLNHLGNLWNKASQHFASEGSWQSPLQAMEGNYILRDSTGKWGYSKARISIKRLDVRHVVIVLACEWKHAPKTPCDNHFFAKWRDDGVYLQDKNTAVIRMFFSPTSREIAIAMTSVDGKTPYGVDLFVPTDAPPSDATLARRFERAQQNSIDPESVRISGPYDKWDYENNRIEFLDPTL
ncbi:M949_RS01915 family surface polysaccharide biosynthesis protein [Pseudoduganella sp. HUAS MS19]